MPGPQRRAEDGPPVGARLTHRVRYDWVGEFARAGTVQELIRTRRNGAQRLTDTDRFEHNDGHGKQPLSSVLASLSLLAFLLHTILDLPLPSAQI